MLKEILLKTDLVVSIIGICVMIISFFLVRTLRQIDQNQSNLYSKLNGHETRLSTLEGEHKSVMNSGGHKWK